MGFLGYDKRVFRNDWYATVGVGIRLKNEMLVFGTIQLSLFVNFGKRGLMSNEWIQLTSEQRMQPMRYIPGKPEQVSFRPWGEGCPWSYAVFCGAAAVCPLPPSLLRRGRSCPPVSSHRSGPVVPSGRERLRSGRYGCGQETGTDVCNRGTKHSLRPPVA